MKLDKFQIGVKTANFTSLMIMQTWKLTAKIL